MGVSRAKLYRDCELKLRRLLDQYDQILTRPGGQTQQVSELVDRAEVEIENINSFFFRGRIKDLVPLIQRALAKIADGTYGICEETGELISEDRLRAVPWTTLSLKGAIHRESSSNVRAS